MIDCSQLCGTWSFVVQAVVEDTGRYEGSLTITEVLTGTINLPDPIGNTLFTGSCDPQQGTIELLRPIPDDCGSAQHYRGRVDFSTQPPTMRGNMTIDYGPGCVGFNPIYEWSAQKQS